MSGLPSSWASVRLGEVASVVRGITFPASSKEFSKNSTNVCCLRTSNVQSKLRWDDVYYVPREYVKRDDQLVHVGDVLMSMANSYELVGKVALASYVPEAAAFGAFLSAIRPTALTKAPYLFHLLRTHAVQAALRAGSSQTTNIANISVARLGEIVVPLAPVGEQQRIADKLDTVLARVDACRDRLARVAPLLKRFRQSVLAAATSGRLTEEWRANQPPGDAQAEISDWLSIRLSRERKAPAEPDLKYWRSELPRGWIVASTHQFAECLDRLRVPVKREDRNSAKGLFPYYGANGEVGRIDEYIFDDELVLVTEDETFYGREKPIAYRASGKCWVNNHAHVLRARTRVANDYLCFALMHYDVLPWLTGTTGRAKLTQQALNSLPVAIPPNAELEEIVRRVETLFAFADRLEARLAQAQTAVDRLTPSLLAKAFRGELVPQDPADEPAAELLKRLAASRAAPAPKTRKSRQAQTA